MNKHIDFFAEGHAAITLISALPEGVDRMAAQAAVLGRTPLIGIVTPLHL